MVAALRVQVQAGSVERAAEGVIPGAETAIIPAARHMTIVENPSGTASPVLSFIGRH